RPFTFRVAARCDSVLDERFGKPLRLEGVVEIPGIAEGRACKGTLLIALPFGRKLAYALTFTGEKGKTYRFYGRKDVRYLRLLRTMTTLRGELFEDGVKVGEATLHFPLRTLPRFLLSFRPWHTKRFPTPEGAPADAPASAPEALPS
ncbi:MAG: hypothetical protein D6812_07975, partial [Deltaproteobacteria bacterium]